MFSARSSCVRSAHHFEPLRSTRPGWSKPVLASRTMSPASISTSNQPSGSGLKLAEPFFVNSGSDSLGKQVWVPLSKPPKSSHEGEAASHRAIEASKAFVGHALRTKIESVNLDTCLPGGEDSFFVADLGMVYNQHVRWLRHLPRVEPFYAVKCNGDPLVLRTMAQMGMSFDCASKNEISSILDLGVDASKIIYANPCKTPSHLRFAAMSNVEYMTFDNADELLKCKQMHPRAKLLLRIITDDSSATCQLSAKFGAAMEDVHDLLAYAKKLELNVVGVAFHVGSGGGDPSAYADAVENARCVFDEAERLELPAMTMLDIGGGFEDASFEDAACVLRSSLDQYFPATTGVRIIAEPGRYYVAGAFTLAANVIGRRWEDKSKSRAMLYINEGVYGNLNSIMFDHQEPVPRVLTAGKAFLYDSADEDQFSSRAAGAGLEVSVWGPTCDGLDCVVKSLKLSHRLEVGDWVYFDNVGAYTLAAATTFNGYNTDCDVVYVCSAPDLIYA